MNVKIADSRLSKFKKCSSEGFLSRLESCSICISLLHRFFDQMLLFPKGLWPHLLNKMHGAHSLHRHWVFKIPSLRSRYPKSEVNSGLAFPSWFFFVFFHCGFTEVLYNRFWKKLCFHVPSLVWQPRVTNRGTEVSAYRGCCLIFHNRNTFHLICSCERLMLLHSLLKCFEQKALRDICVWLSKCYLKKKK